MTRPRAPSSTADRNAEAEAVSAAIHWLGDRLSDLAPAPEEAAPDEARLTAIAELALLVDVVRSRAARLDLVAFAARLETWLVAQSAHPSLHHILRHGPALALSAPLSLRAYLGDAVEDRLPADRLLAAAAAFDLQARSSGTWRALETGALLATLGGDMAPLRFERTSLPAGPLNAAALYRLTHEVFHLTRFGRRGLRDGRLAADLARALHLALQAGHLDLVAELVAAQRCVGLSAPPAVWSALAGPPEAGTVAGYHLRLVTVLAGALGAPLRAPTAWSG